MKWNTIQKQGETIIRKEHINLDEALKELDIG